MRSANAVNGVINIVTKDAGQTQGALLDATASATTDNKVMHGAVRLHTWEGGSLRVYGQVSHANNFITQWLALDPARTTQAHNKAAFRLGDRSGAADRLCIRATSPTPRRRWKSRKGAASM